MSCPSVTNELTAKFGLPNGAGKPGGAQFADPFLMDAAMYMPHSLENCWDWCFFLFYMNPQFRQSWKRVVSHFLTDVDFFGEEHGDEKEQREHREILIDQVDIFGNMLLGGQEVGCYGNSFFTHYMPFDRTLIDDTGGKEYALSLFSELGEVKYDYRSMRYEVVDLRDINKPLRKRRRIKLRFRDRPSRDLSRFKIVRLDPREITLVETPVAGNVKIVRRYSQDFIQKIRIGDPYYVDDTPIEHLEAVARDMDFAYHPDHIYHLKAPTILGLKNNGWGMPETLANFRQLHHLQVLRRIDEAVGQDYILPFRVFTPDPGKHGDGMAFDTHMGTYKAEIAEVIARRRLNPYAIHAMPFPVTLQECGGNGKNLVQADAIEFHTNNMLDSAGIPIELYRGTMQVQNMPTALRLFEGSWQFFYHGFNRIMRWTSNAIQDLRRAARLEARLARSKIADDLEERGIYLQLAASGEISRARAYGPLNIDDPLEEKKKRFREDLELERERLKMDKQFQQEQTAGTLGSAPQGPGAEAGSGYGNPPAGGGGATPLDVMSQAQAKAQELLAIEDDGMRSKMLAQLRGSDPTMHAAVKQQMEEMRDGAASQGRQQVAQMAQQQ